MRHIIVYDTVSGRILHTTMKDESSDPYTQQEADAFLAGRIADNAHTSNDYSHAATLLVSNAFVVFPDSWEVDLNTLTPKKV